VPRIRDIEQGKEIGVPIWEKDDLKLDVHSPLMELGEPIDTVVDEKEPFAFPFAEFTDVFSFVVKDVVPRFLDFLPIE
jgi:hypothetical protein